MERATLIRTVRTAAAGLAAALLCALSAAAQERWPALMDVTGVSADDALNLRAEPWAHAQILGTLEHDATGVEVIETDLDGEWGRVALAEGDAWASLTYLARQPGQEAGDLPLPALCTGTEPFWTFEITGGDPGSAITFRDPEASEESGAVTDAVRADGRLDRFAVAGTLGDESVSAVLALAACSDGMSDRPYGLSVDLLLPGPRLLSGCCRLTSPPATSD